MIDKKLLALLGHNKKYIFYAVGLMIVGLFANLAITASICYAIQYAAEYTSSGSNAQGFILPAVIVIIAMAIRYVTSRSIGDLKDTLGRNVKKDLRQKIYDKIIKLGVRTTDNMSMAGLTQLSMEGVEQLDLYYSAYIPQVFYAMIAPIISLIWTVTPGMRYHYIFYYHILCIILIQIILNISNFTISQCIDSTTSTNPPQFRSGPTHIIKSPFFCNRSIRSITPFRPTAAIRAGMFGSPNLSTIQSKSPRQLSGA